MWTNWSRKIYYPTKCISEKKFYDVGEANLIKNQDFNTIDETPTEDTPPLSNYV
jgi:hypothetical protein